MRLVIKIFIIALVAKALTLPLLFVLPETGVEHIERYSLNLYRKYPVAKAFGIVPQKASKKVVKKPIYQLTNLKLVGIYSQDGYGVVAIEEKEKILFLETGEKFKGYTLIRVEPDRAIFEKGGKEYELRLKEDALKDKFYIPPPLPNPDEVKFAVLRQDVMRYKRNFSNIWKNIAIDEEIDPKTKRLKGFRVKWVKKDSIFGKIGLQKGDLIIGANNRTFQSYSDVFKLYNSIDKLNALKLTIIRNNEKKELEYEIY